MAWIKSHRRLADHPPMKRLARLMGWSNDQCIGKLHRLWWWALDAAPEGDLRAHDAATIADAAGVPADNAEKFLDALVSCGGDGGAGFLDREPHLRLRDWWDCASRALQSRWRNSPEKWRAVKAAYKPNVATKVATEVATKTLKKPDVATEVATKTLKKPDVATEAPLFPPSSFPSLTLPSYPIPPFNPPTAEIGGEGRKEPNHTDPDPDRKKEPPTRQARKLSWTGTDGWINLTQADLDRWRSVYPAVDTELELIQMSEWLLSNPSRRYSNWRRFATAWLKRAQDGFESKTRGRASTGAQKPREREPRGWSEALRNVWNGNFDDAPKKWDNVSGGWRARIKKEIERTAKKNQTKGGGND